MASSLPGDAGAPNAAVLGRLLVMQQAIDEMPDAARIAAFVRSALLGLPGIADACVYLAGHTGPPNERMAALLACCVDEPRDAPARNILDQAGSTARCFPIEASGERFGWLVLRVDDAPALSPYLAFLGNIAGTIGRTIATRRYQARLAELNAQLREARDTLEERVAERTRELVHRTTHDQLTGLANRTLLVDRLHGAIAAAQRHGRMVAVVYLDLDSFKFMNSGLGSACGDRFLRETARRLCGLVREGDTVARVGSDEFVILLAGLENIERSSARLTAMHCAVREPVKLAGKDVVVTCSIGASVFPLDGATPELLLRRAGTAVHRAKAAGKDSIRFYAGTRDAAVADRMELETELRHAIPGGQLAVYYQPKLDVASDSYVGAEALARWRHPRRGLLAPRDFIPLAEDSALIVALGEQVLLQACRQARSWQDAGLGQKTVAVNVAARQLRDRGIVDTVARVLGDTGLAPASLELEVTESSIMLDHDHAAQLLRELKELGVSISIDDFGTGYSSLSALRNFPADKLKIDRSFVHEIETAPSAAAVALAVISFAKTLGLRVNAEGVETPGQALFLKEHGCDEIQGFLLAEPAPPQEVQALFRQSAPGAWQAAGA